MRLQDPLPDWTTHLALVHKDGSVETGKKQDVLSKNTLVFGHHLPSNSIPLHSSTHKSKDAEALVDLDDVSVTYGNRKVSLKHAHDLLLNPLRF